MNANALCAPAVAACDDAQATYRLLAVAAVTAARAQLDRIAMATDSPDWRHVDAADFLDAAHDLLARNVPT